MLPSVNILFTSARLPLIQEDLVTANLARAIALMTPGLWVFPNEKSSSWRTWWA